MRGATIGAEDATEGVEVTEIGLLVEVEAVVVAMATATVVVVAEERILRDRRTCD